MTHNCGQPSDQCTCLTQEQLDSLSPDLRRIVVNAHRLSQEAAAARREQVFVANCDEDEPEDADADEDEEALVPTRNIDPGTTDDLDMAPPVIDYAEESARDQGSLTANQVRGERAERDARLRALWSAADRPCADL